MRIRSGAGPLAVGLGIALLLSGCTGDDVEGTATPAPSGPTGTSSPDPAPSPTTTEAVPVPEVSLPSSPTTPEATPTPAPTLTPTPTDRPVLPEEITVTGTVQAGVESSCLLLDGLLLIGGSPDVLRPGNRVIVTGRIDQTMVTFCQQGIPLIVTSAENA